MCENGVTRLTITNEFMNSNKEQALLAEMIRSENTNVPVTATPLSALLGYVILTAQRGRVEMELTLSEQFTQGNGVIQGGAATMALDTGLAYAALSAIEQGQTVITVNMQTQFYRPIFPGRQRIRAWVDKPGRKLLFCIAELIDQEERVLARAESPLLVTSLND
jgi:acyl-CoA thioesterase